MFYWSIGMKNTILFVAVLFGFASPTFAGSPDTTVAYVAPVAPAAATITDWSGFYVGGMASFDSGTREYDDSGFLYVLDPATAYGAFAGYNFQRGSFVYGGELAYSGAGITVGDFPDENYTFFADLKARAGYVLGDALIYGVVGASATSFATSFDYPSSGFSYGAGLDYLVTDSLFVGAEYLVRDMSGFRDDDSGIEARTVIESAQIRIGYKF